MNLRKVAAVSAERLPDVGYSVEPDYVDALIAEVEHVLCHVVEDNGVAVIEIPLVGVEGCHNDFAGLVVVGEISGGCCRENFREILLKLAWYFPVVEEEVAVLKFFLAAFCPHGPFVILACVVHDEIQAHTDTA